MKYSESLLIKILYFVICPAVFISYLFESFSTDVKTFFGAAFLTDAMGGIDQAWEIKPPGNRVLFYLLSKLPGTGLDFQIIVKVVCGIFALVIIYYFSKSISERIKTDFAFVFILSFLAIFAASDYMILQPEWSSALIVMLMTALLLSDKYYLTILSGFLCLPLLLLKGITIILILIVFGIVHLLTNRELSEDILFFVGAFIGAICFFGLELTIFPNMISDMFLSVVLSHVTMFGPLFRAETALVTIMLVVFFAPIIIIGGLLFFNILFFEREKLSLINLFWFSVMWAATCIIVVIQSEPFMYIAYPLIIPSIITICYYGKILKMKKGFFYSVIIAILIMWACFVAGWGGTVHFSKAQYWENHDAEAKMLNSRFNLTSQPTLLYLDPSYASWYFKAPSASRYITPLPIQRDASDWNIEGLKEYQQNLKDILNYSGEYIVSGNGWFFENITADKERILEKLNTSYELQYSSDSWNVYHKNQ